MKILIIQENGRHDKNKNFRECFCAARAFRHHGHEVDVWGLGHDNYETIPDYDSYDLIINLENYDETGWVPNLSKVQTKKLLWAIDAHVKGVVPYFRTAHEGSYSKILQATKEFVNNDSIWFPNCYDHTIIKPQHVNKLYDIGFCGNVNNRGPFLDILDNHFNLKRDIFVIGDDMVYSLNSYRVSFNFNIGIDINYRNFETLGCATPLLTSFNPHYSSLGFVDGKNCYIYKTSPEMIEKAKQILDLPHDKYQELRSESLKLAHDHTYEKRIGELLQFLERGVV